MHLKDIMLSKIASYGNANTVCSHLNTESKKAQLTDGEKGAVDHSVQSFKQTERISFDDLSLGKL